MLLLRTRDTDGTEAPDGKPVAEEVVVEEAPTRACSTCAAAMAPDQDWCLECGTAAPGRLGGRPGWRAAGTITALTLLLVGGAVAAGYAAVTQDAERRAGSPATGDGAPIVAQTPPAPTPAPSTATTPAPGATTPTVPTPKPQTSSPSASATPKLPKVPAPTPSTGSSGSSGVGSTPAPTTGGGSTGSTGSGSAGSGSAGSGSTGGGTSEPATIDLPRGAVETYDPYRRSGAETGDPNDAADGSPSTSWDVTVPADGEDVGVGLLVDLGKVRSVRSLEVTTPTTGWKAEIYASSSDREPTDVLDKRWKRVTDVGNAKKTTTISLANAGGSARRVVIWFKRAGAPADAPKISIGEVVVRRG